MKTHQRFCGYKSHSDISSLPMICQPKSSPCTLNGNKKRAYPNVLRLTRHCSSSGDFNVRTKLPIVLTLQQRYSCFVGHRAGTPTADAGSCSPGRLGEKKRLTIRKECEMPPPGHYPFVYTEMPRFDRPTDRVYYNINLIVVPKGNTRLWVKSFIFLCRPSLRKLQPNPTPTPNTPIRIIIDLTSARRMYIQFMSVEYVLKSVRF